MHRCWKIRWSDGAWQTLERTSRAVEAAQTTIGVASIPSHGWFDVSEFEPGVVKISEPGHRYRQNSYLVYGEHCVASIDAGMGFASYHKLVRSLTETEPVLLLTHAHWDHVGDAHRFRNILVHPSEADDLRNGTPNRALRHWFDDRHLFGVELPEETNPDTTYIPGAEPDGYLNDGDVIDLGDRQLEVLHTPGHSIGSVSFLDRRARLLFPGDAVTAGAMLCNFSGTDPVAYRETLRKLADLADDVDWVFPAHMDAPAPGTLLAELHEAYEAIWAGDVEPRVRREGTDIFRFEGFSFWLSTGRYGAQVTAGE